MLTNNTKYNSKLYQALKFTNVCMYVCMYVCIADSGGTPPPALYVCMCVTLLAAAGPRTKN